MDHETAIRLQAAERYIAGELSTPDRDDFEEHFFSCPECAEEVRWEQMFAANARAALREKPMLEPRPPRWREWLRFRPALVLSMAGNAALLVGLSVALLQKRDSTSEPRFHPVFFAPPQARGEAGPVPIPVNAQSFGIHFPSPDRRYSGYIYEVTNEGGVIETSSSLAAPETPGGELYLQVPTRPFRAGVHRLVLRPQGASEVVAQFTFRIQR